MRVWQISPTARTAALLLTLACLLGALGSARAQDPAPGGGAAADADAKFAEAMNAKPDAPPVAKAEAAKEEEGINLLQMASPSNNGGGGVFMYPIYFFSFIVVVFGIERTLALRSHKIIPQGLVEGFGALANNQQGFDPRKAYRLCQQFPSTASNVIKSVLVKIGRPHSEVEHAVVQASEREAAKLYKNVRPLNLAATAAPLLGLIGTVQGMIMAFFVTAHLPDGANKAQKLAEGVYVALITTFAGLCVAIPAVVLSHYLEGKIQLLFREIDELVYNLLPQLERYEGKLRVSSKSLAGDGERTEVKPAPVERQPAATE